ncbi:hypothetical protein BDV24DRAFT_172016 [Aspergillus arachidicola]|uniref:Uncharacterized protein n=1 Tax=Aspergillus arachidicola TaxID=656916 RepID=A0A5N6XNB9_9EURO|nr:hypothetical protein BDV24DRAFT_172016 [Aspergillus arachidicola]
MEAIKRPASLSSEETYFDDPHDEEVDSEWEKITQDPAKRVAFERGCIEHELTNEKRVILLKDNPSTRSHCRFWECIPAKLNGEPNIRSAFRFNVKDLSGRYYESNKYCHVSCIEQIFPDLAALIERGDLRMDGGVTQMTSASWQISRFHDAIEDWFRYKGCSFDWNRKSNTAEVNHQLEAHGDSSRNCEKCGSIPDEPLRKDYFPEEPQSCLLSEVLASVIGVQHLDGVPVDGYSNLRHVEEVRRS